MRLGIIARSDNTGLGNQTLELVKMLNPDKVMLIDSTSFNGNKQYPERYAGYDVLETPGFPTVNEIRYFLDGLDVVLSCEVFYSHDFTHIAQKMRVKTILQYNYELFDIMNHLKLHMPDVLLSPSTWNLSDVQKAFGSVSKVMHLPPPTTKSIFDDVREENLSKDHKRILHVAGRIAAKDRNGTESVFQMLKYSKADYELVIKVQHEISIPFKDSRVTIETGNPDNREDLYSGFDAMILPRRYGGLCLPMNEALLSGMPVFMSNVAPNDKVLPQEWLYSTRYIESFLMKSTVDLYEAMPQKMAQVVDLYVNTKDKTSIKNKAVEIGNQFSLEELRPKYIELLNNII